MNKSLEELFVKLGITPKKKELYELAFTHRSCNFDANTKHQDYERLEFIGDAVIGFVVADLIFQFHPELGQGKMTKLRSFLVQSSSLSAHAHALGLDAYIRIGNSLSGSTISERFFEDVFEALVGVMYYDQGQEKTYQFVKEVFLQEVKNCNPSEWMDYKSDLQEALQAERRVVRYEVTQVEGTTPDNPTFSAEVYVDDMLFGKGRGTTKKMAEKMAAKSALEKMAK